MLDNSGGLCSVKKVQAHSLVHSYLFDMDPWIHVQTLLKLCRGKPHWSGAKDSYGELTRKAVHFIESGV